MEEVEQWLELAAQVTRLMRPLYWSYSTLIKHTDAFRSTTELTYCHITLWIFFPPQKSKRENLTASIEQVLGVCISLHVHIKFAQGLHKWDCLWGRWLAGDCSGKGSHWGTNIQWGPEGLVGKGRLASEWPPVVTPSQGWWGALSWV